MKKSILSLAVIFIFLMSCKKDKPAATTPTCAITVAGIAANFKLTKIVLSSASDTTDVSNVYLDDCKRSALYQLKSDKTLIYTEEGTTCTGSGSGSWDVANNKINFSGTAFNFDDAPVSSWNCTTLIIAAPAGNSTTLSYTFTKQ